MGDAFIPWIAPLPRTRDKPETTRMYSPGSTGKGSYTFAMDETALSIPLGPQAKI